MASSSDTVECGGGESPRNLVVKLQKLEDQLGLTRWTTWSEVKVEPEDDYEDSDPGIVEDGGMEWVPVKEEPPEEEADPPPAACLNGTGGRGREERHSVLGAGANSPAGDPANWSDPATSVALPVLNGAVPSMANATSGPIAVMSPETCAVDGVRTTSSSPGPIQNGPSQVSNTTANPARETGSCSTTAVTSVVRTPPHVPDMDALKIQSPLVGVVSAPSNAGDVSSYSSAPLMITEEHMDMTDIASSQLTAVDDQVVEGLVDVMVAVSSSSPTSIKLKRADRHAHRKGRRGKKTEKVPLKKTTASVKKTHRRKKGRPPKAKNNHVSVADSEDTVSWGDRNHVDVVENPDGPSKAKRKKDMEVSDTKDKGMFPMHPKLGKRLQGGSSTAFNLFRLAMLLPNEEAAVEFGQHFNMLPRFRFCPLCGQRLDKLYRIVRQGKRPLFRFQCNKQPCKLGRNQVPLRWGTKFVSSNLSLRKAIILDYCFIKKYDIPTAKSESAMPECEDSDRMVSTSTETVVDYYNHCRETCAFSLMSMPPIGGLGYTVELYESFFVGSKSHNEGGSKSHKVHAFQGQYILAGICIENNEVLFAVTPDLEPNTMLPLLQTKIALGTHVRTSSCEAYSQLKKFGYEHTVVKDTQLFIHNDLNFSGCSNVTQGGTMRPLAFHRRSGTFNLHLAEYLWRRKHRESSDLFVSYLETVASVYPVSTPVGKGEVDETAVE